MSYQEKLSAEDDREKARKNVDDAIARLPFASNEDILNILQNARNLGVVWGESGRLVRAAQAEAARRRISL